MLSIEDQQTQVTLWRTINTCVLQICGGMTCSHLLNHTCTIKSIAEEYDIQNFLIDVRESPYLDSITTQYNLAYEKLSHIGYRRYWKTALLTTPDDRSYDFLETVASNTGYIIKIFRNMQDALQWFRS